MVLYKRSALPRDLEGDVMSNKRSNGNRLADLERRLWSAADQLWANSPLRPS